MERASNAIGTRLASIKKCVRTCVRVCLCVCVCVCVCGWVTKKEVKLRSVGALRRQVSDQCRKSLRVDRATYTLKWVPEILKYALLLYSLKVK